jgi:L-ribulose-5-phosphate 3-epimerase
MKLAAELPARTSDEIIEMGRRLGITATGFDLDIDGGEPGARAFLAPFVNAGMSVVQLACYRNLISVDDGVRTRAIAELVSAMNIAGAVGVDTVVCGGGHRDPAIPSARRSVHRDNWSELALDILIESCREIVARVNDGAAPLCLEPWVINSLSTPTRLERVVRAVDHPKLAVELDLVNIVTLDHYFDTSRLITECFDRFGDKILLIHLKDALLTPEPYPYHIGEVVVGDGVMDYESLLKLLANRALQASMMVEHLHSERDIERALTHMRSIAGKVGVNLE